jgi:hypothetical protein
MKKILIGAALILQSGLSTAATIDYEWFYTGAAQAIPGSANTISVSVDTAEGTAIGQHTTSFWSAPGLSTTSGGNTYQWDSGDDNILQKGGSVTLSVSFATPIPADQLILMVADLVGEASTALSVTGGSATTSDFTFFNEDFGGVNPGYTFPGGVITPTGADGVNHAFAFIVGNSTSLVSSLTLATSTIGGDFTNIGIGVLDVTAVPVPAAAWLFGSGLLGLIGISRRKKA